MSFAVGYVEPVQYRERDPTSLDTVLEALRGTSKGRLPYPEPLVPASDDVCDSKYIGDLQYITSSLDFRDEVSFSDSYTTVNASIFADDRPALAAAGCEEAGDDLDGALTGGPAELLWGSPDRGPDWTSYRAAGGDALSPVKSPELARFPHYSYSAEDEDAVCPQPPKTDDVISAGEDLQHNVESLLSHLQIDKSLPAVLARVKQYQTSYVARVAAIHSSTMAELERCREEGERERDREREQRRQQQLQLAEVVANRTDQLLASKASEAEQRKEALLSELAERAEQEEQAEQQKLLAEQQTLLAEQQQEELGKQLERDQLVEGLKETYLQFSTALDTVLQEIRECEGVELPAETNAELNSTLQQGNSVLTAPDQPGPETLQHTSHRLQHGITVLHQIRTIIDSRKSESETSAATSSSAAVPAPLLSLAKDNPSTDGALSQVRENFRKLSEVHKSVSDLCSDLTAQNSEARSQLSRALAIVNQFNNESDASNRQKMHQLINLVSGAGCEAGGVHVSVGDKQGPEAMFVREQLANKLIALAHDKQVNSQALYSSLMLRLWQVDPLVQHLCLYHLYRTCPYLVPYLPLREEYSTEEEYHRALGYRQKDGGVREALDSYLKRMGSAGQLYGRLVSIEIENSPLTVHNGWRLLSCLLVSPAQSAVTCCVLHGFLSTAGAMLVTTYGQQFHKLMGLVCSKFLPLLEEATMDGGEADLASFKVLLENYCKTRSIPAPTEGYRALL